MQHKFRCMAHVLLDFSDLLQYNFNFENHTIEFTKFHSVIVLFAFHELPEKQPLSTPSIHEYTYIVAVHNTIASILNEL